MFVNEVKPIPPSSVKIMKVVDNEASMPEGYEESLFLMEVW